MVTGKFYAVRRGRKPGVYLSWVECEQQVKGYSGSQFKSFQSLAEAEAYLHGEQQVAAPRKRAFADNAAAGPAGENLGGSSGSANQQPEDTQPTAEGSSAGSVPATAEESVFQLEFDGASKGNPGRAGGGALLRRPDGTPMLAVKVGAGNTTNNVAEYRGLIEGLRVARGKGVEKIRVQGDSKLVSMQVQGRWQVGKEHLVPLCEEARLLAGGFKEFCIKNIPRALNPVADSLANQAIFLPVNEVAVVEAEALPGLVGPTLGAGPAVHPRQRKRPRTRHQLWGALDASLSFQGHRRAELWASSPLLACSAGHHRLPSSGRWRQGWLHGPCQLGTVAHQRHGLQLPSEGARRQRRTEAGGTRRAPGPGMAALARSSGPPRLHRQWGEAQPMPPLQATVSGSSRGLPPLRHLAGAAIGAGLCQAQSLLLRGAVPGGSFGRAAGQLVRAAAAGRLGFC